MQNKIVVRYQDGRILKGTSADFMPNKDLFHIVPLDAPPGKKPQEIHARELKAVFFVKEYDGNAQYKERTEFSPDRHAAGRKIKVVFKDEELLVGTTQGYSARLMGALINNVHLLYGQYVVRFNGFVLGTGVVIKGGLKSRYPGSSRTQTIRIKGQKVQ